MKSGFGRLIKAFFGLKIRFWALLLACVLCVGVTYGLTVQRERGRIGSEETYNQALKYLEIKNKLDEYYVGTVDEEAVSSAAFAAMVDGLGDEWSYYMSPAEYGAYQLYSANQYVGLGVTFDKDVETGGLKITAVNPGTPAANASLAAGDIITSIAGQDITEMTVGDARSFLNANLGESVALHVLKGGKDAADISVNCEMIYTNPVTSQMREGSVGYVKILNFQSGSADAAIAAIENLLAQGARGFVFDLRMNPGGLMTELDALLDYLLPSGVMYYVVDEKGESTAVESDSVCLDLPMAVVVNADTFAAAEIFAAALQDYNWADIVGDRTTGKSRSQQTIELSDGSAIHLSTTCYLTPRQIDLTEQGGVIPDQEIALTETGDTQLTAALATVQWML